VEDSKSNPDGISDENESISTDGNSSTSTCNSQVSVPEHAYRLSLSSLSNQHDLFSSPSLFTDNSKSKIQRSLIKRTISRRPTYNLALTPVAEHLNDEEIGDEFN